MQDITEVPLDQLHPHEKNPRIDAAQVEDLCWSVHEHGIEVPLVVVPRPGGDGYTVIAGHRRMTAAITAELTTVPVQIREDLVEEHAQLTFMATENLMRDQLTVVEEARLVQDLLDLGLSQAEIAKQTALGKKRVSERVKLSKLQGETGEKVHRGQIPIEQALVIAEYADDPESVEALEDAAGTYYFDQATARAMARRETRVKVKAAEKEAKKAGARLADPDGDFVEIVELSAEARFATAALDAKAMDDMPNAEWTALLISEHASCPGHCALATRDGLQWGCDQAEEQHPYADDTADAEEEEPAESPLDRFADEDLAAMAIYRGRKIHEALAAKDLEAMVREQLTSELVENVLRLPEWREDVREGTRLLLGLDADPTEAQVRKAASVLPVPALLLLTNADIAREQSTLAKNKWAWQWRAQKPTVLSTLMRSLEVEPSDLEKELRTAHGFPWDAPTEDESAEGAETAEVSA